MSEHKNKAYRLQRRMKAEREVFVPSTKRKKMADAILRAFR